MGVRHDDTWRSDPLCVDTRDRTCFLSNTDNICRYFRENVTGQDVRFEKMGEIGSV